MLNYFPFFINSTYCVSGYLTIRTIKNVTSLYCLHNSPVQSKNDYFKILLTYDILTYTIRVYDSFEGDWNTGNYHFKLAVDFNAIFSLIFDRHNSVYTHFYDVTLGICWLTNYC